MLESKEEIAATLNILQNFKFVVELIMALRPWIEEKAELEEALFESNCSEVL